jgi:S-adenosylmethionine hydrolase
MRRYSTISFLSDYGHADEFVGVVKSVIRVLAPEVEVVDLCHEIPAHDVRAGALTLARSAQYLAPGVVLAVVDPGVGTERRAVAVEVGEGQSILVGPDNGLLAPAVAMVGGATRAVQLTNPDFQLEAPGPTFAGRDVFAPAAAHLCKGVALTDLGEEVDPASLLPGVVPVPRIEGDSITADVLWIDRFGNAQLNIDPDDLVEWGDRLRLRVGDDLRTIRRATSFEELGSGDVGLVVDSYGLLALATPRSSAAALLRLEPGAAVVLERAEPDARAGDGGVTSDVELRPRP